MTKEEIQQQIIQWLQEEDSQSLQTLLTEMLPEDIVDVFYELKKSQRKKLFILLPGEIAAEVLNRMEPEDFEELLGYLNPDQTSEVLEEMSSDDVVDILGELPKEKQSAILNLMDEEGAREVRELLGYEEDTAGGIMTKDFIALSKDLTVEEAIGELRRQAPDAETIYYIYVVDHNGTLVGVVSLRELIIARADERIENIMREKVVSVRVDTDQEEVARQVSKYGFLAIPVVDFQNRIIGIVTVDDVFEVIEEETSEDIARIAGTVEEMDFEEENVAKRLHSSVRSRLPWLIITLFGGLVSSSIIRNYEGLLQQEAILAAFMPLLTGMGGNVGTQSSTLTVRALATGQLKSSQALKNILQEGLVGLLMGAICGLLIFGATVWIGGTGIIGALVAFALCANMITAATIGTLVPLVFKKIGVDPAVASAPFISTTIDATGLTIYFGLVTVLLRSFT